MASLLIVEDEEAVRQIFVERLSNEGYEVFVATNGVEGISQAREHQPDIIISDINMPKMDGIRFYKELQNDKPELAAIPFIFLTGKAGEDDEVNGIRLGVDGYLRKPVRFDLLSATIKSRIGYHKRLLNLLESSQKQFSSALVRRRNTVPIKRLSQTSVPLQNSFHSLPDLHVEKTETGTIKQGFVVWDDQYKLVAWSRKCPEFWYNPHDILKPGMPMVDLLVHIADAGGLGAGDPEQLAEKEFKRLCESPVDTEEEFQMLDNRIIRVQRHKLETGGHASTYTDITERKQAEEARDEALRDAKRANEAKTEFLAHVSHELRTPLNAIIGFSQIWMDEVFGPLQNSRYMEYAKDINNSGTHLLEIISDILDLSKVVSGETQLNLEDINIAEILEYCITSLQRRVEFQDIPFQYQVSSDTVAIRADRKMLKQILLNIAENALQATTSNGQVTINAQRDHDGTTRIEITDSGVGMSPEAVITALEPFGKVRDSANLSHTGIGLGLPLAKQKTELHGGTFTLDSVQGKGTTVTITFPPEMTIKPH